MSSKRQGTAAVDARVRSARLTELSDGKAASRQGRQVSQSNPRSSINPQFSIIILEFAQKWKKNTHPFMNNSHLPTPFRYSSLP